MVCPNCHSEYTNLNPCGCSGADFPPPPQRDSEPGKFSSTADATDSALKPTGIGDPFWH